MSLGPEDPKVQQFEQGFLKELAARLKTEHISLKDFVKEAWKILEPGKVMLWNWHIDLICEYLELVTEGKIQQLLINIPTRYMKSLLASVMWPAWEWTRYPTLRHLCCSYAQSLSTDLSTNRRDLIESEWYQSKWSRVKMKSDQNLKTEFENTAKGKMIATSVGGRATGKGGDRVIIDDLLNPEQAYSEKERVRGHTYFDRTLSTRLDNKKLGSFVVIEQRLHVKDFTSHLLKQGGWTHLSIPAENTTSEPIEYVFPKSGRVKIYEPGEILWPEREGRTELDKVKVRLGSRGYAAQGLQDPKSEEGTILKRSLWRFYTKLPCKIDSNTGKQLLTLEIFDDILQSWDLTFKESVTADFVVGQVWGRIGADRYLIDQVRGQWGIVKSMAAIVSLTEKYPRAARKLIEAKANGDAVMELLKKKIPGLTPINPKSDKLSRARAVEPIQESGNIFLPAPEIAPWVEKLIDECAGEANNDDQLDCLTQANNYWTINNAPSLRLL